MAGITGAPVDMEGKGEGLQDPRSGFVHFVILQFGASHYSLAKGRKHIKKKLIGAPGWLSRLSVRLRFRS